MTSQTIVVSPGTKLEPFDGVRGIAILLVMTCHFWANAFGTGPTFLVAGTAREAVDWLFMNGSLGVQVFFVLSGFLIHQSLMKGGWSSVESVLAFYGRRARRILPAFAFMSLLYLILVATFGRNVSSAPLNAANMLANFTFLSPLAHFLAPDRIISLDIVPGTWSLNPEIWFYALAPLAVWASQGRRWPILVLLLVLSAQWRVGLPSDTAVPVRFALPGFTDSFLLGMLSARLVACRWFDRLGVFTTYAGVILFVLAYLPHMFRSHVIDYYLTASLGSALLLHGLASRDTAVARSLSGAGICAIGRLSYGMFLCHITLVWYVVVPLTSPALLPPLRRFLVLSAVGFACALALASLCYKLVEQPWLDGRARQKPVPWAMGALGALGLCLVVVIGGPRLLLAVEGHDLLSTQAKLDYSTSSGAVGRIPADDFPRQLKVALPVLAGEQKWIAIYFPVHERALVHAVGEWVIIRATVTARGNGYSSCLGGFDGQKDQCTQRVTPGESRKLAVRVKVIDPVTFQAKINVFPKSADADIQLDLSDVAIERGGLDEKF